MHCQDSNDQHQLSIYCVPKLPSKHFIRITSFTPLKSPGGVCSYYLHFTVKGRENFQNLLRVIQLLPHGQAGLSDSGVCSEPLRCANSNVHVKGLNREHGTQMERWEQHFQERTETLVFDYKSIEQPFNTLSILPPHQLTLLSNCSYCSF